MTPTPTHPLVGKPFVFTKDNKKRRIGTVTGVDINERGVSVTLKVTDRAIAEQLGVPADSELEGLISDVGSQTT